MDRRTWLLSCAAWGGGAGCAVAPAVPPPPAAPVTWPPPPERARFQYEATLRNAASLGPNGAASLQQFLGGADLSRASFGKPLGIAAGRGRVYVADTEGRRIFVFDLPRRRVFAFGLRREGELKKPAGVALDAAGRVYVIDSTARRLVVYDPLGLYLHHVDGSRDWVRPTALAVRPDGERLYVVDTAGVASESHRVHVLDGRGRALRTLGGRGSALGQFNLPVDAAVGPDGRLWVLDAGNFRVQAFDDDGRAELAFGSVGNALGQFARPRGLAVDDQGLVYVSDAAFCNIQVFTPGGELLLVIGRRAERDAPGQYLLPAKLATDETGRLYVVDQFLHKIEVLRRLTEVESDGLRRERPD